MDRIRLPIRDNQVAQLAIARVQWLLDNDGIIGGWPMRMPEPSVQALTKHILSLLPQLERDSLGDRA